MDERRRQPPYSPASLAEQLRRLPAVNRYWIAYSGGCDSHALLHAAARLRDDAYAVPFHAVHVDHGLQPSSRAWAQHCAAACASLNLPLTSLRVDAQAAPGESPEAAARHARYGAFAELIEAGDCLLTAHHQDDQAETLLLQLLRGGGPHGLAAMPECAPFSRGWHARPLLAFPRSELRRYAEENGLRWIDDPSNEDVGYDRNYLRTQVVPRLRERWPAASRVLTRAAAHQAEAAQLLDVLAAQDFAQCRGAAPGTLRISALTAFDAVRQRNLLRYWLKQLGHALPDSVRLHEIQHTVLTAAPDREPVVAWSGTEVRRYRDELHALTASASGEAAATWAWDFASAPLALPDGTWLGAAPARGEGVSLAACTGRMLTVRYRRGGEQCRPGPRAARRSLKKLLQERGVPPWRRERLPLIYVGDELAAVADLWVCAPFHAAPDEAGVRFEWKANP